MLTVTPSATSCRMTGTTRRSSSSTGTRAAPGRVDSPPTSTMSAPSATNCEAVRDGRRASRNSPPSEKLSGVTLSTPKTRVRPGTGSPGTGRVDRQGGQAGGPGVGRHVYSAEVRPEKRR